MARNEATLRFRGDDSDLVSSFNKVGEEAREMAEDIDKAAKDSSGSIDRLQSDANSGLGRLNEGVEGSVGKFRGFKDTIDGTTDIAEGFATGDVSTILGGFADLADGVSSVILPKLQSLIETMGTKVGEAVGKANTALSTFGSGAALSSLVAFGGVLAGILVTAEAVDAAIENIFDLPETFMNSPVETIKDFLKDPLGFGLDDFATGSINQFKSWFGLGHTGGIVPGPAGRNVPMVLQAGEQVIPRGQTMGHGGAVNIFVGGSVITERDLGRVVAGALRDNRITGVNV